MNCIPPDEQDDPIKIANSEERDSNHADFFVARANSVSKSILPATPTVTQDSFADEDENSDNVTDPDPEQISATSAVCLNLNKTVTFSEHNSILLIPKNKQSKKKNKSCTKVQRSVTKPSPWISRLPKRLEMIKKEKEAAEESVTINKKKKKVKEPKTVINLRVGALVKKRLSVLLKEKVPGLSRVQFATVFGTLKEKVKGGKWLVLFENERKFTLKPSQFDLVSSDSAQQVIAVNVQNEMVLKTAERNDIERISKESLRPSAIRRKNINDAYYM